MKKVILLLTLLICIKLSGQETIKAKNLFVRVFNLEGAKIGKGHIYTINDSILVIKKGKTLKEFHVTEIGKIKTKHSGGHNFLIGAASGVVTGTILGTINPPTETSGGTFTWAGGSAGDELVSGITTGLFLGTIAGGISAIFKNPKKFSINANSEKWSVFVEAVKYNF